MKELTKQALEYRNLGLSIIPLGKIKLDDKGNKIIQYPIYWTPYTKNKATEEEIINWFEVKNYPNIGIITGKISQLFVLDVDSYKQEFDKKLFQSFKIPPTPVQKTARGGNQYFFKYDGGARNAVGIFKEGSGIDIRANGGMVIAPPTVTSYGKYEWIVSPFEELFAPLPQELEKLFGTKKKKELHEQISLSVGSRDDSIASIAGKLALALPPHKWDSDIFPVITAINATYKPPLSKEDLLRIYRSITSREKERRNIIETQKPIFIPAVPFEKLMAEEFPPARFAIEPFFELQTLSMISAPPNTWKSWITFLFASSIASGNKTFGKFQSNQSKVMIVNEEDSYREVQDRFKLLGLKEEKLPIWFRVAQGAKLDKDFIKMLIEEARSKEVSTVFFDSLRAMHTAEENDSTAMQEILDMLKAITREGFTVIFTHHHRKKNLFQKNSDDPEMARGSSAISAAISGHISLEEVEREGNKFLILRHLKSKVCAKIQPVEIAIITAPDKIEFNYIGEMQSADKKLAEAKDSIYAFLENENRWISRKELFEVCKVSDRTLKTALLTLEKEENIFGKTRKMLLEEGVTTQTAGKGNEKMYFRGEKEEARTIFDNF